MKTAAIRDARYSISLLVALLSIAGVALLLSTLAPDKGPLGDVARFGDMPVMVAEDGSIVPDPNALGIGPEGVTSSGPGLRGELAANLAAIPDSGKLILDGGNVVAVVSTCTHPENYDPTKRCVGLHDLATLSVVTMGPDGEPFASAEISDALARILADAETRQLILEFMRTAPAE